MVVPNDQLPNAVFGRIAERWLQRSDDLAALAATGSSFEEWLTAEAFLACHSPPAWQAAPRPRYSDLGDGGSSELGDLLVDVGGARVLVEVALVHELTESKWRRKLEDDMDKLHALDGRGVLRLQVVLLVVSGRYSNEPPRWLNDVEPWTAADLPIRRAELAGGGRAEVRALVVDDLPPVSDRE